MELGNPGCARSEVRQDSCTLHKHCQAAALRIPSVCSLDYAQIKHQLHLIGEGGNYYVYALEADPSVVVRLPINMVEGTAKACLQASLIERALEEEMQLLLDLMPNKNIAGYRGHVSVFDEATGTCHLAGAVLERATCDLFDLLVFVATRLPQGMLTIDCPAVDVATAPSSSTCVSNYQKAVLSILDQLLAALEGVQLQGYVHRDIKLENVLLMAGAPPGQQVKLSDFDTIARLPQDPAAARGCFAVAPSQVLLGTTKCWDQATAKAVYDSLPCITAGPNPAQAAVNLIQMPAGIDVFSIGLIGARLLGRAERPWRQGMEDAKAVAEFLCDRDSCQDVKSIVPPGTADLLKDLLVCTTANDAALRLSPSAARSIIAEACGGDLSECHAALQLLLNHIAVLNGVSEDAMRPASQSLAALMNSNSSVPLAAPAGNVKEVQAAPAADAASTAHSTPFPSNPSLSPALAPAPALDQSGEDETSGGSLRAAPACADDQGAVPPSYEEACKLPAISISGCGASSAAVAIYVDCTYEAEAGSPGELLLLLAACEDVQDPPPPYDEACALDAHPDCYTLVVSAGCEVAIFDYAKADDDMVDAGAAAVAGLEGRRAYSSSSWSTHEDDDDDEAGDEVEVEEDATESKALVASDDESPALVDVATVVSLLPAGSPASPPPTGAIKVSNCMGLQIKGVFECASAGAAPEEEEAADTEVEMDLKPKTPSTPPSSLSCCSNNMASLGPCGCVMALSPACVTEGVHQRLQAHSRMRLPLPMLLDTVVPTPPPKSNESTIPALLLDAGLDLDLDLDSLAPDCTTTLRVSSGSGASGNCSLHPLDGWRVTSSSCSSAQASSSSSSLLAGSGGSSLLLHSASDGLSPTPAPSSGLLSNDVSLGASLQTPAETAAEAAPGPAVAKHSAAAISTFSLKASAAPFIPPATPLATPSCTNTTAAADAGSEHDQEEDAEVVRLWRLQSDKRAPSPDAWAAGMYLPGAPLQPGECTAEGMDFAHQCCKKLGNQIGHAVGRAQDEWRALVMALAHALGAECQEHEEDLACRMCMRLLLEHAAHPENKQTSVYMGSREGRRWLRKHQNDLAAAVLLGFMDHHWAAMYNGQVPAFVDEMRREQKERDRQRALVHAASKAPSGRRSRRGSVHA